jgi:ATP-dependent DNA helicase RecG
MTLTLDTPLTALHEYLPRVGPKTAQKIAAEFAVLRGAATLDAATVEDLAFYLPFRYEDRSHLPKIDSLHDGLSAAVEVEIRTPTNFPVRTKAGRQLTICEFSGRDETGQIRAYWWNQPYLLQTFKAGRRVILFGEWKFSNRHNCFQIENAEYEILSDSDEDDVESDAVGMIHVGRRTPIYRKLGVLRTRALRTLMFHVLERLEPGGGENLPNDLAARCGKLSRIDALRRVHFPENDAPLEDYQRGRSLAHARLAFEEFFLLSLAMLARREGRLHDARPAAMHMTDRIRDRIHDALPFTPTEAQRRVVREIIADMTGARPMSRLLQGDVGAGKTVVALQAMIVAVENGYQAALMAPTEILAEQHTLNLKRWLRHAPYRIVTLTGRARASEKRAIRAAVAAGEFDIVIGTQALIQEGVEFSRLGLAVIDEQHRFGVMQRERLVRGGVEPGVLVMTATPIPRSLAMSLYGDLDVSALDELPPGRQPVRTVIRTAAERARVHDFIRAEAAAGRQSYIIFPLVAESEKSDLAAAVQAAEELQRGVFRDLRVGLLHGRMKSAEKEATMAAFASGEYQVLVSTTVVEVGIDVPNASVMVIEGPERFGLAQLHQLRGRIGRGAAKSYCVLMASGKRTPDAEARMKILCETQDGFVIAEKDLELRGPGEMLGVRQSGIPLFRVGNIVRDRDWLEAARDAARRVMNERRHSLEVVRWLDLARRTFPDPGVGAH